MIALTLLYDLFIACKTITTDTRDCPKGSMFFALKGANFNGNAFAQKALDLGCAYAVIDEEEYKPANDERFLLVDDVLNTLQQLANYHRKKLNTPIVGITGTNGKTTTKELLATVLAKKYNVLYTLGNLNNDIGVPLTLLRLTEKHRFAVIELGANHQNEINYTTKLVQPNAALINNIAPAHLEGFGSLAGVVQAKGEIYRGLTKNGVAIINAEHNHLDIWQKEISNHAIQYFNGKDYSVKNVQGNEQGSTFTLVSPKGSIEINLPYLGEHNVKNALAATVLAMNVGASLADVKAGLEHRSQVKGRLFPIQVNENLLLLDDPYNANVDSLQAAIDVLKGYDAFRILLVGDMKELGEDSLKCHQQVGEHAKQAKLDLVLSYGTESAVISEAVLGKHFTDKAELTAYALDIIKQKLQENQKVVVLAKGSRSMKMEETIYSLKDSLC